MKKKLFILLLIYVLYATGGCRQRSDKYANDSMTGIEAVVKKKSNINEKENKSIIAIGEADVVESEKSEDENGVKDRPHIIYTPFFIYFNPIYLCIRNLINKSTIIILCMDF